jgi:hypothetical protein
LTGEADQLLHLEWKGGKAGQQIGVAIEAEHRNRKGRKGGQVIVVATKNP